jgi:uncharacterized protein with HEPN domain
MTKHGPASDLAEIEAAVDRIQTYTAGMTEAGFCASMVTYDAVAMNFIVIGEAVRRIDGAVLAREPAIPWAKIVGQRNRIAHGYEDIDPPWLWRTISESLPPLLAAVKRLLSVYYPEPPQG